MTMKPEKKIERQADKLVESTVGKLVKMVEDQLAQKRKEAKKIEEEQREKLMAEMKREEELKAKLKEEKAIAEKMIAEYQGIERKIEKEAARDVEEKSLTEVDVQSGKVSLSEFLKSGKNRKERLEMAVAQSQGELKEVLSTVRQKNLEILGIEKELYQTQDRIFSMAVFPLQILEGAFKSLVDFIGYQGGFLREEISGAKSELDQIENKLNLATTGQALTSGFRWPDLSFDEARRVEFDPTIPERHIEKLKVALKEFEGLKDILITVEWFWKGDEFFVEPARMPAQKPPTELRRITDE